MLHTRGGVAAFAAFPSTARVVRIRPSRPCRLVSIPSCDAIETCPKIANGGAKDIDGRRCEQIATPTCVRASAMRTFARRCRSRPSEVGRGWERGTRLKKVLTSMAKKKTAESTASGGAATWNRRWEDVERWIAFSDLHVSRRTIDTCIKVLRKVHEEAMDRNAGVLFLGDFWHARGSLPVEPLNEVLDVFRSWTCPTIMISGNHDQVNVGGDVHALKPIEAASDFIKVIDHPMHFLGALFLPYRRDGREVQESIDSANRPRAIFAHVDVVGAHMNETFQAQDGIHPSCFPSNVPVYTGHYHKPHTVQGTAITYLGSPYQGMQPRK